MCCEILWARSTAPIRQDRRRMRSRSGYRERIMRVPDEGGTLNERGVMPTQSMSAQHLAQSQRIDRSCALLVVIKIDEDGAAPLLPLRDLARPMAQRPVRVVIAVASARSMTPDIDM